MAISPLIKTRVLKVHVEAALEVLNSCRDQHEVDNLALAWMVAGAVVTATDRMTRYCVVVLEPNAIWIYGPYATYDAAVKAIESKELGTREGAKGYVAPMIPAPKIARKKKK